MHPPQSETDFSALADFLRGSVPEGRLPEDYGIIGNATLRGNVMEQPPGITWVPAQKLDPADQIVGENQYYVDVNGNRVIDENDPEEGLGGWGYNLCGQISIAMILENLLDKPQQLDEVFKALGESKEKTGVAELGLGLAKVVHENNYPIDHWVHAYENRYKMLHDNSRTQNGSSGRPYAIGNQEYPEWLRKTIHSGHYYIAFVGISTENEGVLVPQTGGNHWVVITGFSEQWDLDELDSRWNWVRINNPFKNREEYYWWSEFRHSVSPSLALEIWHMNFNEAA